MYFVRCNPKFTTLKSCIRLYSIARKSHYDILNLRKNCTDKEIKEAFIQMSKEYHPDKNKDVKAQAKFVQIVEAYNVLSKPSSRAQYDNTTEVVTNSGTYVYKTHVPYNLRNNPNYSYYYENQNKTSNAKASSSSYYGMTGVKRLSNVYIIVICFGVTIVGVLLQIFVIKNLYIAQKDKALERSKRLAEELSKVRSRAIENGNELQTRLLIDKIVTASNPTVATASLGQALANEKK